MKPASRGRTACVQRYAFGLRFAGQLQHEVVDARSRRAWATFPMPWLYSPPGNDDGRLCLLQATALLARARAQALPGPVPALSDSHALATWCADPTLSICARVREVEIETVGETVRDILRSGGACGLQLEVDGESRWMFVSGLESADEIDLTTALLLLDSKAPPPWLVGYNARVELQGRHPRQSRHARTWSYRTIHGGERSVRPRALLDVRRSGVHQSLDALDEL